MNQSQPRPLHAFYKKDMVCTASIIIENAISVLYCAPNSEESRGVFCMLQKMKSHCIIYQIHRISEGWKIPVRWTGWLPQIFCNIDQWKKRQLFLHVDLKSYSIKALAILINHSVVCQMIINQSSVCCGHLYFLYIVNRLVFDFKWN